MTYFPVQTNGITRIRMDPDPNQSQHQGNLFLVVLFSVTYWPSCSCCCGCGGGGPLHVLSSLVIYFARERESESPLVLICHFFDNYNDMPWLVQPKLTWYSIYCKYKLTRCGSSWAPMWWWRWTGSTWTGPASRPSQGYSTNMFHFKGPMSRYLNFKHSVSFSESDLALWFFKKKG